MPDQKKKKRVGRGGKKGTYSGRGVKGQSARAGGKMKPLIRELLKRYPKIRGSRAKVQENSVSVVRLGDIERAYLVGEQVHPRGLCEKGLVSRVKGRIPGVKVLATGSLTKALVFTQCAVSTQAKAAIEKAGGSVS